jgi:signal transduction histidine kinase
VLFWLLIRWQLRPLARMAQQASGIGPGNLAERIAPVGSSAECVRLRESINAMLSRLAEGLEREHNFASSAAHELRTPLAQLRTQIEVALRKQRDAAEYRTGLAEALVDVERLEKLVLGLLQLTRSQDDASIECQPVSLGAVLKKVQAIHGGDAAQFADGEQVAGLLVRADEELLAAAISNVLDNAARYAPGAPATVTVTAADDEVVLVVADRGPGVPEAERERIFDPLTRLDEARSIGETADGFGLGLAVARAAVRRFGGDLVCRGRTDGDSGAEFVFRLPRADKRGDE